MLGYNEHDAFDLLRCLDTESITELVPYGELNVGDVCVDDDHAPHVLGHHHPKWGWLTTYGNTAGGAHMPFTRIIKRSLLTSDLAKQAAEKYAQVHAEAQAEQERLANLTLEDVIKNHGLNSTMEGDIVVITWDKGEPYFRGTREEAERHFRKWSMWR